MVQLIVGSKGDGKTKHLLDRVNNQIKTASGNIVYLDKNTKHMHELDNKVRLINLWYYFTGLRPGADVSGQLSENRPSGGRGSDRRADSAERHQRAVQGKLLSEHFR